MTVSGFASTVSSRAGGSARSSRSSSGSAVKVGVPPPRKIVSTGGAVVLGVELSQQRVDVRAVQLIPAGRRDEVAVAAAVRAERQVDVEMTLTPAPSSVA